MRTVRIKLANGSTRRSNHIRCDGTINPAYIQNTSTQRKQITVAGMLSGKTEI